jgi:hypothetical protein
MARREWDWKPDYDVEAFFQDYFLPSIRTRYGIVTDSSLV